MYFPWILYLTSEGRKGEKDFDIVSLDLWLLGIDCGVKPEFLNINKSTNIWVPNILHCTDLILWRKQKIIYQQMTCQMTHKCLLKEQISEWTKGWTKYILLFWFVCGFIAEVKYLFSGDHIICWTNYERGKEKENENQNNTFNTEWLGWKICPWYVAVMGFLIRNPKIRQNHPVADTVDSHRNLCWCYPQKTFQAEKQEIMCRKVWPQGED